MNTAAAYARYSTDHQTENSIAYQMHEITGYCAKNNINLTHSFIDKGQSGTNMDRDGFQDMLVAARAGEFNDIIIYDVTRGSRDVADWFYFRKKMRELNINVVSCKQQLGDPLDPNDFLRELITVGLGHHSVLETRQKVLDGVAASARDGLFLGGVVPYGLGVDADQHYCIIPSEAAIVRQVFQLYYDGYSYNYIMEHLRIRDIVGRKGSRMNKNSLYYMLRNPRYAGIYVWNEYTYQVMRKYVGRKPNPREIRVDGVIPAIVDLDVWQAVQERLDNNKHQNRRVSPSKHRTFLLSGLIKCGICGSNYIAHASTSKGHEYKYYCCTNRYGKKRTAGACHSNPARGEELEAFVVDSVKRCLSLGTDFRSLAESIASHFNNSESAPDLFNERNELESVKMRLNNGVKAILDGLDGPELREQIQQLKLRKQTLEATIDHAATSGRVIDVDALESLLRSDVDSLDSADQEVVKVAVQHHVPYIIANEDGSFTVAVGYLLPTKKSRRKKTSSPEGNEVVCNMAGAEGLEPSTNGFGDHYSTN